MTELKEGVINDEQNVVSESGSGGEWEEDRGNINMFRIQKIKRPCCSVLGPSINTTKMSRQFSFFA